MRVSLKRFRKHASGSAAVEFALVIPAVLILVLATYHLSFLVYAASSLHWTVEQTARCAAMSRNYSSAPSGDPSVSCQTISSTKTYANSIYKGPSLGLSTSSFTAAEDTGCNGRKVTGSGTYPIRTGFLNLNVPVSAQACYATSISASSPWT